MDLEAVPETVDESYAEKSSSACEGSSITEPYVGMVFDSEEAAKQFYDEYARRQGFIVRLDRCHRSEADNRIISRRLSCNKQGFHVRGKNGSRPVRKPRVSIREGCEAMMLIKADKCGKWVVSKFVKEHSHPLIGSGPAFPTCITITTESKDKDKRIQQLMKELDRRDRQCQRYRKLIHSLVETVEEQTDFFSRKLELVLDNVKQLENEEQTPLDTL